MPVSGLNNHVVRGYALVLLLLVGGWLALRIDALGALVRSAQFVVVATLVGLYLASHVFRMLRLAMLTLDERDKGMPLMAAHALTAFPSSFLPFKLGEVLRLAAFFYAFDGSRKALAVWLIERFGDLCVITAFILSLYLFNIEIPYSMRAVVVVFLITTVIGVAGLIAVANSFVYLNRHLVLTSHSPRGLQLLRASHAIQMLRIELMKAVEGRIIGLTFLSVLVWAFEIAAVTLFFKNFSPDGFGLLESFAHGLLRSLPGGADDGADRLSGLYQSVTLAALGLGALLWIGWAARRSRARGRRQGEKR
jgi:hypothetical protein